MKMPTTQRSGYKDERSCLYCGRSGHKAHSCRERQTFAFHIVQDQLPYAILFHISLALSSSSVCAASSFGSFSSVCAAS